MLVRKTGVNANRMSDQGKPESYTVQVLPSKFCCCFSSLPGLRKKLKKNLKIPWLVRGAAPTSSKKHYEITSSHLVGYLN
jgi:hypothetical protein